MKKLNNKGYMLVEIVIASVISLVIVYFLIDITIKMINKNNDYYIESLLLADKNVITKEIMDDINNPDLILSKVSRTEDINKVEFTFSNGTTKELTVNGNIIKYGNNIATYTRELNEKLNVTDIDIENNSESELLSINIPAYTNYSNENYGINLVIKYDSDVILELPTLFKYEEIKVLSDTSQRITNNIQLSNNVTEAKCEIIYDDSYTGLKSATVDCTPQTGKNISVTVDNGEADDQRISCTKSPEIKNAEESVGACNNYRYSCSSGTLYGAYCYSTDSYNIRGGYTAHFRCGYGQWENYNTTDATYTPCRSGYNEADFWCYDNETAPSGSCSPEGKTTTITATCIRVCEKEIVTDAIETCISYDTNYSCSSNDYSLVGTKCYKCLESGFSLNSSNNCVGTCLNYIYKVKIQYK